MTPFDTALSKIHGVLPGSEMYDAQLRPILEALINDELREFVEKSDRQKATIARLKLERRHP